MKEKNVHERIRYTVVSLVFLISSRSFSIFEQLSSRFGFVSEGRRIRAVRVDRPYDRPSQKAGGKLGTRKMTERLSCLAVVRYQQTYTRAYLGARNPRESSVAGQLSASPFTYPCYPVLALSSKFLASGSEAQSDAGKVNGKKRHASDEGVGQCALLTAEVRFSEDNRSTYTRLARERAYIDQSHLTTATTLTWTRRFQAPLRFHCRDQKRSFRHDFN